MEDISQRFTQSKYWGLHSKTLLTLVKKTTDKLDDWLTWPYRASPQSDTLHELEYLFTYICN